MQGVVQWKVAEVCWYVDGNNSYSSCWRELLPSKLSSFCQWLSTDMKMFGNLLSRCSSFGDQCS